MSEKDWKKCMPGFGMSLSIFFKVSKLIYFPLIETHLFPPSATRKFIILLQ